MRSTKSIHILLKLLSQFLDILKNVINNKTFSYLRPAGFPHLAGPSFFQKLYLFNFNFNFPLFFRSISRAVSRSVSCSVSHSVSRAVSRSVSHPVFRSVSHPVSRPVFRSVSHPVSRPVFRSVSHPSLPLSSPPGWIPRYSAYSVRLHPS